MICWGEIARARTQTSDPLGEEIDHPTLMPNHEKQGQTWDEREVRHLETWKDQIS